MSSDYPPQSTVPLTAAQQALAARPLNARIFLEGPAGCGKTTAGLARLRFLQEQGAAEGSILLLVPQPVLAAPYAPLLDSGGEAAPGGMALTLAGLAQHCIEKFWLLAAGEAGFAAPDRPPVFLNVETAQYYMARLVRPLLREGYFGSAVVERSRLYTQILNNLNRSAAVGFPHAEIGERLKAAWVGDPGQARLYEDVQASASRFRRYCLEENLLDFSLQVEVFVRHLWPMPACRQYLQSAFQHLIVDNLEESVPVLQDVLADWLPQCASALLIYDWEAGFRTILSADPVTAYRLKDLCPEGAVFERSLAAPEELLSWITPLAVALGRRTALAEPASREGPPGEADTGRPQERGVRFDSQRYYPQMLDRVAEQVAGLVFDQGILPAQIAILAPFVSDALRFALVQRLERQGVALRSHRPSRSLRAEPPVQCLLTLAALAHPGWGLPPPRADVAAAFVQAIAGVDPVRAQLLAEIVYRVRENAPYLTGFETIRPGIQERITYEFGQRYEELRLWLEDYQREPQEGLNDFLIRLYAELLSQPGFRFEKDARAEEIIANLIDSAQNFQRAAGERLDAAGYPVGPEFLALVQEGIMAASYPRSWQAQPQEAVLLAPVYTFLSANRPVDAQFWLDIGSPAWYDRPEQPLGHPYVLSRHWPPDRPWTDIEEFETAQEILYRLAAGLLRRCRKEVYLEISELSEQGYEQRGMLLRAFERAAGRLGLPLEGLPAKEGPRLEE